MSGRACLAALGVSSAALIVTSAMPVMTPMAPVMTPGARVMTSGARVMTPGAPVMTPGAPVVRSAAMPAPANQAFSLGVLRRDGILIPFAAFNGHDWSIPWPDSDTSVPLPIRLDDVPKKWWGPVPPGAPWTALLVADATQRPLKIEKPQQVRVFCEGRLGLLTDYTGAPVDSRAPSIPKDGLAAASEPDALPLQPIVEVSLLSPDAKNLVRSMTDEFNKQEKLASGRFTSWGHPYESGERAAIPIELEALYRFREKTPAHSPRPAQRQTRGGEFGTWTPQPAARDASGEWLMSYVEAVRRFPARPEDNGCGLITFVHGWVTEWAGGKPDFHLNATVTYCDREGVAFMLPLGHLSVDGENYWVYQMSSWRDEVYTVALMRPDEVRPVVSFFGGGCPK